jgi:uncharacterized protein (DUF58 family)
MKQPHKEHAPCVEDPDLFMAMDDLELVAHGVVEGLLSGEHKSKFIGFSNEFDSHRKYIVGDDLRHVNWNLWAKTDRLYVKQYEADTNLNLYLLMDQSRSMLAQNGGHTKWAYAARAAASLAYLSLRNRDATGLFLLEREWGVSLPPAVKGGHLQHLVALLEQSVVADEFPITRMLDQLPEMMQHRGIVVLFSDLMDNEQELLEHLDQFKQMGHEVIVFQVLDPYEVELPTSNSWFEFVGLEGGGKRKGNTKQLAEAYQLVVKRWQDRLYNRFKEIGVDWVKVTTNQPLQDVLVEYLLKRIHH